MDLASNINAALQSQIETLSANAQHLYDLVLEVGPKYRIFEPSHVAAIVGVILLRHPALVVDIQGAPRADALFALCKVIELIGVDTPEELLGDPGLEALVGTWNNVRFRGHANQEQLASLRASAGGVSERREAYRLEAKRLREKGQLHLLDRTAPPVSPERASDPAVTFRGRLNLLGEASRRSLPDGRDGQIAGGPRPPKRAIRVFDLDGVEHEVESQLAADRVRLKGWSYQRPAVNETAVALAPDDSPAAATTAPSTATATERPAPLAKLDALRAEAEALGVDVEKGWGVAKLRQEIEAAAKAAPKAQE